MIAFLSRLFARARRRAFSRRVSSARIVDKIAALAARFARVSAFTRVFRRAMRGGEPALSQAGPRDAHALAMLHGASFHRGWSDGEFEQLLIDRNVVAHRATVGRKVVGFILSRIAADEAEILSVAVTNAWRGRGLARRLLDLNLRRLAGLGTHVVFLEVDEANAPARRLYQRAGFRDVGRREGYYPQGKGTAALILRRDLL